MWIKIVSKLFNFTFNNKYEMHWPIMCTSIYCAQIRRNETKSWFSLANSKTLFWIAQPRSQSVLSINLSPYISRLAWRDTHFFFRRRTHTVRHHKVVWLKCAVKLCMTVINQIQDEDSYESGYSLFYRSAKQRVWQA